MVRNGNGAEKLTGRSALRASGWRSDLDADDQPSLGKALPPLPEKKLHAKMLTKLEQLIAGDAGKKS